MTDGQRATTRAPLGDLATFAVGRSSPVVPGEPTREALDTVLELFRTKLLPADV